MTDLEASAGVRPGDVLVGKYRIDRILGVGGMGVVVAAHHLQLDEHVALKFLRSEALHNADAVERFAREARAAVKIKSEHVARVSDVGVLENGAPYMVMEYLEGRDLERWLSESGPLSLEQAAEFLLHACEAVAEAHALGIVHRDLKPANLFVIQRADGTLSVKVLDFGISKMSGSGTSQEDHSLTKTSALMGSPLYMSPEQMQSPKDVDARSDTWALGVVLYELLTGIAPFTAETAPELVLKIVTSPPPSLAERRPDLPPGVHALVLTCLQKDRAQRYATVAELAAALAEFAPQRARGSVERIAGVLRASGMSASALALPSSSGMRSAIETQTLSPLGRTLPGSFDARKALGLLAGLLALGAVASFLLLRPTGQPVQVTSGSNAPVATALPPAAPPAHSGPAVAEGVLAPAASPLPVTSSRSRSVPAAPRLGSPARNQTQGEHAPPASAANVAPAPASRPPAPAVKKRNCDPNFYLDAQGEKRFKPECF